MSEIHSPACMEDLVIIVANYTKGLSLCSVFLLSDASLLSTQPNQKPTLLLGPHVLPKLPLWICSWVPARDFFVLFARHGCGSGSYHF